MISEQLKNFIKKQKSRIVVYPNDLFEQRVQEEMIRADEYKSFFVYVDLDFAAIRKNLFKDQEEKCQKDQIAEMDFQQKVCCDDFF